MLYITFGDTEDMIRDCKLYFDYNYEPEWLDDPLVREMIKDVDKSEVISRNIINSPVLDEITPKELSGGVKTLILMLKEPDTVFYASNCGDNCAKWILEIANRQDLHITLGHIMEFGEPFGELEAVITNDNSKISTIKEYVFKAVDFI